MGSSLAVAMLLLFQVSQQSSVEKCACGLKNATLTLVDNALQLLEVNTAAGNAGLTNVSRCFGGCEELSFVCRPTLTSLQTVTVTVPWKLSW